jgi:hypothetical protein
VQRFLIITKRSECVLQNAHPSKRNLQLKLNVILEWFDGKDHATKAIKDNFIINEELVEQRPELVSSSCVDSLVNIEIIRKRCTNEAWRFSGMILPVKPF